MKKIRPDINNETIFYTSGIVQNRVIVYESGIDVCPIVFVPGWASSISTWRFVIPELKKRSTVYYFETREKPFTKRVKRNVSLDIDGMSSDLVKFINHNITEDYILIGASMGASSIINGFEKLQNLPKSLVLITPNNKILLPKFFFVMQYCPHFLIALFRPIALRVIKLISYGKDGHKVEGTINAMTIAELDIIRKSAAALKKMDLEAGNHPKIKTPTLIIATTEDDLHFPVDAEYWHSKIMKSELKKFKTFTEVHSSRCAKTIINWLKVNR